MERLYDQLDQAVAVLLRGARVTARQIPPLQSKPLLDELCVLESRFNRAYARGDRAEARILVNLIRAVCDELASLLET